MKIKLHKLPIICLLIFYFSNEKLVAQDCINGISFSSSTINVGQSAGSNNTTVYFPSGCYNSTITSITNKPSWITNITIYNQYIGFSYSYNSGAQRTATLTVHKIGRAHV